MKQIILWVASVLVIISCGSRPAAPVETPSLEPAGMASPSQTNPESSAVEMAFVPQGSFTMGSDQETALQECEKYFTGCNHQDWYLNEGPVHEVTLDAYYIDIYEVTNRQYQECVTAGTCTPPGRTGSSTRSSYFEDPGFGDYPVVWVSWEQAQTYCAWRGARLPTEAEWEKAARGTDARLYPWGDTFESGEGNFCDANCPLQWANKDSDDGFTDTAPVGSFPAGVSPYGVYDMGGNVNEWIADWYDEQYYASSPSVNPTGPETGSSHGIRGGSFHTPGQGLRTTARPLSEPSADYIAFRCAGPAE